MAEGLTLMSRAHVVEQGEHLTQIALRYGVTDYCVVWDDPQNADLRLRRQNPNVLMPGDVVYIPDRQEKRELLPTGQRHRFRLSASPLKLCIVLKESDGQPLSGLACTLEIDDARFALTTGEDGRIEKEIEATAREGRLCVPDAGIEFPFHVGHLDPVDATSGIAARLANLGYYLAPVDPLDESELQAAVEEFQCDYGLTVDGICGPKTQAKLKDVHGC